jgi:hypothetical protein
LREHRSVQNEMTQFMSDAEPQSIDEPLVHILPFTDDQSLPVAQKQRVDIRTFFQARDRPDLEI